MRRSTVRSVSRLAPMVFLMGLIFYVEFSEGWRHWSGLVAVGLAIIWIGAVASRD